MKAWQVVTHAEPTAALRSVDVATPEPGAGQAHVRVLAAGVGLPDVLMCRGTYPLTPPLPFIPGQEIVGRVVETGPGSPFSTGDRVMTVTGFLDGHGGFAEETIVGAQARLVPASMSDVDGAAFTIPYLTAWTGLVHRGQLRSGETLVVLGAAGGTGSAAVSLGHALGADVIAVVGSAEKAEHCRRLGADHTVVHTDTDVTTAIRDLSDGGADVVYDPVGGDATAAAIAAIATGGRLLTVGFASGRWPTIDVLDLTIRSYSVVGVLAGAGASTGDDAFDTLFSMVAAGEVPSPVTDVVPFDDVPAALEALATREALGKTVVLV